MVAKGRASGVPARPGGCLQLMITGREREGGIFLHGDTTPENYPLASVLYTALLSLVGHQKEANEQSQTT